VAGLVGYLGVYLGLSQVAVGFVLTLTTRDIAYFFGNPYSRLYGPHVSSWPVPFVSQIPGVGPILFQHPPPVYLSFLAVGLAWWFLYRTSAGLRLRAVGERPEAAHARGLQTRRIQLTYSVLGGLLVGLAGATFSLCTKAGWGRPQGAEGTGWIVLAIVIFGGWRPVQVALGCYLFAFLQVAGIQLQNWLPSVPAQVFQVAPFPLMIFALAVAYGFQKAAEDGGDSVPPWLRRGVKFLGGSPPGGLGRTFRPE
jgi:general nucleoside transport system permease protein